MRKLFVWCKLKQAKDACPDFTSFLRYLSIEEQEEIGKSIGELHNRKLQSETIDRIRPPGQ
jgi:hypothetical protein